MRRAALVLLLPLLLAACSRTAAPAEPPPVVDCPAPLPVEILTDGWQFSTDPNDIGLSQGWYGPSFDRAGWTELPIGRAWEQAGLDHDGLGWYARTISWDGPQGYLFLADADDRATVWVDGMEVAMLGPEQPSAVVTLDNPDGRAFVAIRVSDDGGFGGIKSPPRLSTTPVGALDEARRIDFLEAQAPDLPPAPSGDAWTMIGGVAEADEALIAVEGSLSPWAVAPTAELWLRDSATGRVVRPLAGGRFELVANSPIVSLSSEPGEGTPAHMLAFYDETDGAIRWRVAAERSVASPFDELIIAVRPFGVNRTLTDFCNPVLVGDSAVWLNNAPYLATAAPDAFEVGDTWAGLVYPLGDGTTTLEFAFPAAPGRELPRMDVGFDERLDEVSAAWLARQAQAVISVPDRTVQTALDASLGYLLLASDPDGPHPGPLAHNAIWTRDAAYMGLALLMRGHDEVARDYVTAIFAGQEPDGRVPPIQGEAIPWDNDEWDAQGQAIYLAQQVYRYTADETFLRQVYPAMTLAADYIITLRAQTAADPPATRGLLPRSLSAEDLVDGEQHTYWDNFWAVVGLEQAAAAADVLGRPADAARWRAESADLQAALLASLEAVMGSPVPYIPASVETLDNSGMARGTTPALHPYPIVAPDDPLMTRAFQLYADRWITPYGGGYLHREGQFWTYGGVELANVYLRQNRGDLVHQILGWTLTHQTLPGAFAWAEQVDPNTFSFSGGDMPHAWMASSLTILIRNMIVLDHGRGPDDDVLTLFQTAPAWWFEGDNGVATRDLPTLYGPLTLETSGDLRVEDGRWRGNLTLSIAGAGPPGGFRWDLPHQPASVSSTDGAVLAGTLLSMPGPGTVTLRFD